MFRMNRVFSATLLLIVIVGYAMGTTHAAVHVTSDPGDCTLCATYSSSNDAIPASGSPVLPITEFCDVADFKNVVESSSAIADVHPRGPPLSI